MLVILAVRPFLGMERREGSASKFESALPTKRTGSLLT
jgi:hypothetical protein